ncbi:MAG: hypothetical protein KDA75_01880 [Planctomycetaceae bacterium]|nr:hypothetical protein [Planctomycetaceae bacterium]
MRRSLTPLTLLAIALIACSPRTARACSIPVFRYALEHWTADPFVLHVFHRGPLTAEHSSALEPLRAASLDDQPIANLRVDTIDVDGDLNDTDAALWSRYQTDTLPLLVLQQPASTPLPAVVWSGPLTTNSLRAIHDSPLRQTIASQLIDGESVVWVLLESGDAPRDDDAWQTLTAELDRLEQTLELPPIDPQDAAELTIEPTSLKLSFAAHRLARDNAEEAAFADLLLSVEPDLRDDSLRAQPMVFPIFGRGRALYALVGEGISRETIEDAARFLTTGCQCTVKRDNPGADLLFAIDWPRYVEPTVPLETKLPPLVGLSGFADPDTDPANTPRMSQPETPPDSPPETSDPSTPSPGDLTSLPPQTDSPPTAAPMPAPPASIWDTARTPLLILTALAILGTLLLTRRNPA